MEKLIRTSFNTHLGPARALFLGEELVHFAIPGPGVKYGVPRALEGVRIIDGTHPLSALLEAELESYFRGSLYTFTIPFALHGSPHQKSVWLQLAEIPYGETITYKTLAHRVGVNSFRAVGTMVGLNPIPILLPCHRVVRADGRIGEFSCAQGTPTKRFLLDLEGGEILSVR